MNKIYKVIWSKVKHQYVVVSELAHSNGKQSRTSRNSIRSRIAALVVCGAITAFGVYGALPNSAFAEVAGGEATQSQYIAIAIEGNPGEGNNDATWHKGSWPFQEGYWELNDEKRYGDYTYIRQTVTVGDSQKQYWVRKGYDITAIQGERHESINNNTDYIIDAKKNAQYDASSDQGLLQAYQTTTSKGKITTLTGVNIEDLDTGVYGGASNTSGVTTPSTFGYHIKVGGVGAASDGYIRVTNDPKSSNANFSTYFSHDINLENNGSYSYINSNGEKVIVPSNKVYSIDGKLGVFTDAKGNLYTGDVYGDNNEILLSGSDGNKIYSYWGTKINDLSQTIGNMTVQDYNSDRKKLQDQAAAYHGDDITNIAVGGANNNGTISLNRVGQYNDQTGEYETTDPVPGTITVTSTGGNGGSGAEHDVKIKFSNTENPDGFSVDAGSKVEAVPGENDKISAIKINGEKYNLGTGGTITGSFNPSTGEISVEQDGKSVLAGKIHDYALDNQEKTASDGSVTLTGRDRYGTDTFDVKIDGLVTEDNLGEQIKTKNNLKVEAGDKGRWTITDTSKEEGSQVFTNTTLADKVETSGTKDSGYTYTVKDTAGNTAQLTDIASATKLGEVNKQVNTNTENIASLDGRVTVNEGDITDLGDRVTVNEGDITDLGDRVTVNEGDITDLGNRVTVNEGDITTIKGNMITGGQGNDDGTITLTGAEGKNIATVTGLHDYALENQEKTASDGSVTLTGKDRYSADTFSVKINGLVTEDNLGEQIKTKNNLKVAEGDKGRWTITDASQDNKVFTNTTLADEVETSGTKDSGYTYTVKDTAGNTAQLTDIASATKLGEVNKQVNTNTENIASLDGRVTVNEGDITDLGDRVTVNEGDITDLGDRVTVNEGDITDLGNRVTVNEGDITDLGNRVTVNEGDITTIKGNMITGGQGNDDGTITLTGAEGKNVATVTGLHDYAIDKQDVTVKDGSVSLKVTDRYDKNNTYDVTIDGIVTDDTVATKNNLKVAAGDKGRWTITDTSKEEGSQVFTNTTLADEVETSGDKDSGYTYTVKDTAGNTAVIKDVASAEKLSSVDSKVGDTNYSSTNYIHNGDSLTEAASDLDTAIKTTANKVDAGWKATAGETSIDVKPTEDGVVPTLNFAGDKNISVTADKASSTINVELNPNLEVESVKASGDVYTTNIAGEKEYSLKDIGYNTQAIKYAGDHTAVDGILSADKIQNENRSFMVEENGNITAGKVKVYATTGEVTGLTNTTWDGTTNNVTRAATEGQLQDVVKDIETNSYKGWNVTTNGGETEANKAEVASKGNVDFSNTDENIVIGQNGTNLTFDLNDNIILGDESGTRIQLNGNPQKDSMISITNKDSDTVFNIAKDGTVHSDGDIVAKADSNKKYSLSEVGENAVRYNENKSTVALAGTNGTTITNVADGDVSEGSKEAVNGSQLYATNQKVDAGWVATDGANKVNVNPDNNTLKFTGDDKNNITVTAATDEDTKENSIKVELSDNLNVANVNASGDVTTPSADGTKNYSLKNIGKNTEAIYGTKVNGEYVTTVTGTLAATTIQNTSAKFRVDESGNVAAGKVIINATGDISGLSNTTWNGTTNNPSRAATEGQLQQAAAASKTTLSDGINTTVTSKTDTTDGHVDYQVNLDDNVYLGGDNTPENSNIKLDGENGVIGVGSTIALDGRDGTAVIGGVNITTESDEVTGKPVSTVKVNGNVITTNADGTEKYNLNKIGKNTEAIYGTKVNGEYVTIVTGTLAATTIQNTSAKFRVDESGNVAAGKVIINATGDISGLSNTTWNGTTNNPSRAATEGQLKAVSDDVNAGWIATDNSGKEVAVNPDNNKLNFAGDDNITVTATTDENNNNAINVKLNDNITLGDGQSAITLNGSPQNSDDPALSVGTDKFVVAQDGSLSVSDKFNVDAETGNIYAANNSGSAIMMNDDSVALNAGGNGIVASDEGILLNTNGINEDIKLVTKGTSVSVDSNGTTFTNTNTNETTNINGGTINVGDKLMVEEDGSIYATNNNGSTVMINDNGVALNSEGNGVVVSGEGITLNTNGSAVTVDRFNGTTFTNTNTNETTNINGGTINVGDKLMVEEDGSIYATNNNGSTVMINDNGVALNSEGNGVVVSGEGITLNTNGSAVTVDRFNGTTFTNTNTGETTNINGGTITTNTVKGLSNTTWDDELAKQVANSEELQGTAATQGQLQQAVSEVAEVANAGWNAKAGGNTINVKPNETLNFEGDGNITVSATGGTSNELKFGLNDNITLGDKESTSITLYTDPTSETTVVGTDGNTTNVTGYVPESYKSGTGADFVKNNGGFALFTTDTQGHGIFGVTTKGTAHGKDFVTYTKDIYGNDTRYSLNDVGDAVTQMSSYYNEENGKSYTVFSRYLNEAEKDNPFATVDENATRDIPLALRDDGAVLIGATIKGDDFTDNGIRINAETETTYDEDGNEVTNNIATITGLENTEWKPPTPVATFAANDINTTSRAATEAQLDDLYSAVAAYDVNVDGTIDYSHIALAGAPYGASRAGNGTPTGGTSITNVAYASGNDGSEAVNVDYLKDAISDAAENGSISTSDQHLVANTETGSNGVYKPNDDGNVNLIVSDEKGNSSTITIGDVASKTELDSLKTNVGDLSYSKVQGDDVKDGDSITTAIGKLDNKIENISGTATDADNNTVTGGKINSDGTISLTQKDKDSIKLEGQLTDSGVVQEGTSFDKETGTITITSQDKYSGETSSVKVEGIASTEVVGATNKEDLATAYKDADKDGNATTEYITDSESMVEADVALDHAIQDVANTSYANDMVLSNRIDSVEKRLGNVEERIDKVGAMAAAIANLRTMGFDPEAPTEIAIGVGQYKSETGIAIGVFHYPNQDFMLSASLSSSGDELMGGIGATWKLGRKSAAERAKDEEARHLEQAEEMKKLAQQEKVKAQAQRHAKLLAERQQASQKNA